MMAQMLSDLHVVEIKLKATKTRFLECYQDEDHDKILNIRRPVSGIIHTMLDVAVCWKVYIQIYIASESTDGEI